MARRVEVGSHRDDRDVHRLGISRGVLARLAIATHFKRPLGARCRERRLHVVLVGTLTACTKRAGPALALIPADHCPSASKPSSR